MTKTRMTAKIPWQRIFNKTALEAGSQIRVTQLKPEVIVVYLTLP